MDADADGCYERETDGCEQPRQLPHCQHRYQGTGEAGKTGSGTLWITGLIREQVVMVPSASKTTPMSAPTMISMQSANSHA